MPFKYTTIYDPSGYGVRLMQQALAEIVELGLCYSCGGAVQHFPYYMTEHTWYHIPRLVLAQSNGEFVGWSAIVNDRQEVGRQEIWVFVSPSFRRQRIGTELIKIISNGLKGLYFENASDLQLGFWSSNSSWEEIGIPTHTRKTA